MKAHFLWAASVVIPIIIYMVVGACIRRLGLFSVAHFKALNKLLFNTLIPFTLFFDVFHADLAASIQGEVFGFVFLSILLIFGFTWALIRIRVKEGRDCSAIVQGIFRSNFVLYGATIAHAICGAEGIALIAALAAMVVPLFNVLAVILFESTRGGKASVEDICKGIARNPLILAALVGLLGNVLGLELPGLVEEPLENLASMATPLALVSLGGTLSFASMASHRKYLIAAVTGRLVVVPVLMMGCAIALGFRGDALVAYLAIFATPTAVSSAPMAQVMGSNGELAGEIVAVTSVLSCVTMFLFVSFLSAGGWIVPA